MTGPLLVVAHEGYRNGATRVLADLLGPLRREVGRPLRVRLLRDGPLAAELRAHDDDPDPGRVPAAVLCNSVLALPALDEVAADVPVVVYAHEQGEGLRAGVGAHRGALVARADLVVCVSEAARRDLEALGVAPDRLVVLPPVVPIRAVAPEAAAAARDRCGAGPGDRLVVGCGEATWRKGTDLFVGLAGLLAHRGDVRLAWVGRRHRSFARHLDVDVALLGVEGAVRWIGEVDDALPYLAAADLLVLTSREDPQPLVPFEAAAAGTATVGLAGTGLDGLAARSGADTVAYPDLVALAAAVERLLGDPEARRARAAVGARVVAEERSAVAGAAALGAMIRGLAPPDGAGTGTTPPPAEAP